MTTKFAEMDELQFCNFVANNPGAAQRAYELRKKYYTPPTSQVIYRDRVIYKDKVITKIKEVHVDKRGRLSKVLVDLIAPFFALLCVTTVGVAFVAFANEAAWNAACITSPKDR